MNTDWRNASDYPASGDEKSGAWWAWQFLRRNPEYQADFDVLAAIPEVTQTDEGPENSEAWQAESERLCLKWGIGWMHDPSELDHVLTCPGGSDAFPLRIFDCSNLPAHKAAISFDLRYPIDRQIEHAKALLQLLVEAQARLHTHRGTSPDIARAKGPHQRKLPEYLRAVDARQAGAKEAEIAEALYPWKARALTSDAGLASARAAVKYGIAIMRTGYRDLLEWQ